MTASHNRVTDSLQVSHTEHHNTKWHVHYSEVTHIAIFEEPLVRPPPGVCWTLDTVVWFIQCHGEEGEPKLPASARRQYPGGGIQWNECTQSICGCGLSQNTQSAKTAKVYSIAFWIMCEKQQWQCLYVCTHLNQSSIWGLQVQMRTQSLSPVRSETEATSHTHFQIHM